MANEGVSVSVQALPEGGEVFMAKIDQSMVQTCSQAVDLVGMIADKVAERYVAEHYAELVARLSPDAIANLAIAQAGQRIAKVIHERPVVVNGPKETEVYEKGFFGGVRRVR